MADANDPSPITSERLDELFAWAVGGSGLDPLISEMTALVLEVRHWRAETAATLWTLSAMISGARGRGEDWRVMDLTVNVLNPRLAALKAALSGDLSTPSCEACGKRIWPGELIVPMTDVDMHAVCFGAAEDVQAGDLIEVDPENMEVEEGEARPERAFVTVSAYDDGFDAPRLAEALARAEAVAKGDGQ